MAIKPNDCIIKIKDLEIDYIITAKWDGGQNQTPIFEPYWSKFLEHVNNSTDKGAGWDAYDKNFEQQLKKFNATYKQTKKWDDRYIKFKTHSDLTFFVLRWS
jgi:hypothetical protein